jgi:sugar lactone lactonase YvrE
VKEATVRRILLFAAPVVITLVVAANMALAQGDNSRPIIRSLAAGPTFSVSTIPPIGDLNPYGVAFVPSGFPRGGPLAPGDILVSNFNASSNLQGTGTTIVRIDEDGQPSLFFQGQTGLALTTALGVLRGGAVLVGNVPTTTPSATCTEGPSGQEQGVGQGSLLILSSEGHLVGSLSNRQFLDGPWDLTIHDEGDSAQVFVSNALSGTVTRLDLSMDADGGRVSIIGMTQIASGYAHRCDPAALVVGPTGLALDKERDILYVASTGDNAIYSIQHASVTAADHGTGRVVIEDPVHLHGPLGLVRAPNGDLITSQGDAVNPDPKQPSEVVEYTTTGRFVGQLSINASLGSAFGIALRSSDDGFRLAAVDDTLNALDVWVVR